MSDSPVVGVVMITRHGDRMGFYQNPTSYTASNTIITPLGEAQEFQSGTGAGYRYLNPASPDFIQGIQAGTPNLNQLDIRADGGGEGGVIINSAVAFWQGAYPANATGNSITLANGSTVASPLGGYSYIPVETVLPNEDITLEGFTNCPTFTTRNTNFYQSPGFLQMQNQSEAFLQSLVPLLGGKSVALSNMYNIYDYMNVNNIHNATFHNEVTAQQMEEAAYLANYHEYGVFTDSSLNGIGNVAGQAILQPVLAALTEFQNASQPVKLQYLGVSYKPFLSLFNMTQIPNYGMVGYASIMTYEVRNTSSGYTIRMNFRNGTATALDGSDILPVNMFGSSSPDYPLADFINNLRPYALNNMTQWCMACNQTSAINSCNALIAAASPSATPMAMSSTSSNQVSPPIAGVIGAFVALGTAAIVAGLILVAMRLFRKPAAAHGPPSRTGSDHTGETPLKAAA